MTLTVADPTRCGRCGGKLQACEPQKMHLNGKPIESSGLRCESCGLEQHTYPYGYVVTYWPLPAEG